MKSVSESSWGSGRAGVILRTSGFAQAPAPRSQSRNPHGGPAVPGHRAGGVPLDDDHLAAGLPQLEALPLQDDEGFVLDAYKTRSLPWSTETTNVHLSFLARVWAFWGSCRAH